MSPVAYSRLGPARLGGAGLKGAGLKGAGIALALVGGCAWPALADSSLRWRLSASVPVRCTILDIRAAPVQPASLAITTNCNAERFQLVLRDGKEQPALRAARSSAGPAQISGSAVTITSAHPGAALTTIELAAPVSAQTLAVTLRPV